MTADLLRTHLQAAAPVKRSSIISAMLLAPCDASEAASEAAALPCRCSVFCVVERAPRCRCARRPTTQARGGAELRPACARSMAAIAAASAADAAAADFGDMRGAGGGSCAPGVAGAAASPGLDATSATVLLVAARRLDGVATKDESEEELLARTSGPAASPAPRVRCDQKCLPAGSLS